MKRLLVLAALLFVLPAHAEVTIEWVTVDDPGNACDPHPRGCFGAVTYLYEIGKYEVTNAQYAELLNAVAATDTYELYNTYMGSGYGGITRSGSPGSYTYSAIAGREDMPVNYVTLYDAMRFANWLHNGQPTGAQDSSTTEDGAYDISLGTSAVRKCGAKVFVTSEDEWFKAAYYDTVLHAYYDYPAGSDTETTCAVPSATPNTANCDVAVDPPSGDVTVVGSYTGSASPNGTFDQGGNVWEWVDTIIDFPMRSVRGGCFTEPVGRLIAALQVKDPPWAERHNLGFRVTRRDPAALVPSMSPTGVALTGGLVFGIGILGLVIAARRRLG